ncbi:hypothetical protein K458DRAFT_413015 [Lentithecium fluviatile CBS 122367]|uniref:Uncharacterized protein n=1 Tax=Lentithecium fluviatile CBS 122367 TaxID=1168545 RepID=A0A6G1JI25_9PLEO|nr:hypothetical protein K458DRAFT_413015 [Lentithecium fluviatile CBS 122367]
MGTAGWLVWLFTPGAAEMCPVRLFHDGWIWEGLARLRVAWRGMFSAYTYRTSSLQGLNGVVMAGEGATDISDAQHERRCEYGAYTVPP